MRITAFVTAALVLVGSAPALRAQSLADVARKETDRRKATKDSGKVYTNSDLRPTVPPPDAPSTPDASKPSTAADAKPADAKVADSKSADVKPEDKAQDQSQKAWSKRAQDTRAQLNQDRVLADALQSRINALTTDFVNRDDPAQRTKIGEDRQRAITELDRLKKAIEADTKAIAALEEDARTKGIPPGWIR